MRYLIRQLGPEDATAYRAIRLAALAGDPAAFASDAETERARPLDWYAQGTSTATVLVAFDGETPIAMAGLFRSERPKTAHIATVFGVYVEPRYRGQGLAKALMAEVVRTRPAEVIQLHLGVATNNIGALSLYKRLGFEIYGTEPRALRVEGRFIDEHLMVRFLDRDQKT